MWKQVFGFSTIFNMGGFFGMMSDQQSDVEYTFYGMALEALLS